MLRGHVALMWQHVYGMLGYIQFQTDGLHLWLQLSIGIPTPDSASTPANYPTLGAAKGGTPRTPITVTLPSTRQADSSSKNHRRYLSRQPAWIAH